MPVLVQFGVGFSLLLFAEQPKEKWSTVMSQKLFDLIRKFYPQMTNYFEATRVQLLYHIPQPFWTNLGAINQ